MKRSSSLITSIAFILVLFACSPNNVTVEESFKNIQKIEELYNASPTEFLEVIEHLNDSLDHVAIFSHNNGITYFANSLTNENIEHMPTCSVVAFKISAESWKEFKNAEKNFLFFHKPKEI